MEVSFSELKEKEIVNVYDGKKLGRIIDILFDNSTGVVKGVIVPGEKKLFRKSEDVFVPLTKIKKIGNDVILVVLSDARFGEKYTDSDYQNTLKKENRYENSMSVYYNSDNSNSGSYVRYKRIDGKKYK